MPRLVAFKISNLFGIFNHEIGLHSDDRITIIHGPNGVGKTTVLKLIAEALSGGLTYLRSVPFDLMELSFDDGHVLSFEQHRIDTDNRTNRTIAELNLTLWFDGSPRSTATSSPITPTDVEFPLGMIERAIDSLERIGPETWLDQVTNARLDLDEVVGRYGDVLPFAGDPAIPWYSEFCETQNVHVIETQRLLRRAMPSPRLRQAAGRRGVVSESAVEQHAQDLADLIDRRLAESASISQQLERSFPSRLIEELRTTSQPPSDEDVRSWYESQDEFRTRLEAAGIFEASEELTLPEGNLEPALSRVLWLYLDDSQQKLDVFEELLERIELFKKIINAKFTYKKVIIHRELGFIINSAAGEVVPPTSLSSGEQHELVLTYELLFEVEPDSLILIDEPELSLHVNWQHAFLSDLEQIANQVRLDFIVATHSPQIVHNRWDVTESLVGPTLE